LGQAIVVTIGVTMIAYLMLYLLNVRTSGGIARELLGNRSNPQSIALFDRQNYFNRSFFVQYWHFVWSLVHGHLGNSYVRSASVDSLVVADLPRDLVLGVPSLIFSLLIAIPVGVAQAVRRNRLGDYAGTAISFILYSMPAYAVAILLIQFFSISLKIFPSEAPQATSAWGELSDLKALVLPIASLTLVSYAYFSRYMRSSAIDTLAQDYIRTARAKGLPERLVLWRHLLRNSLITVVTLVGLSIPVILTGGLIIEDVFNFPGLGLLYYTATEQGDFQVMLGITVLVGLATVIGNLMADIGYALLDPRIRY
jgi:peptide/nickel transport system permease protein